MGDFDEFLDFDAFAEAEKLSGKTLDEDEATSKLALGLALAHNAAVTEELALRGDTYYAMPFSEYLGVVEAMGFERIWHEVFGDSEVMAAYWLDGLLLICNSHRGKANVSSLYFNARFENSREAFALP